MVAMSTSPSTAGPLPMRGPTPAPTASVGIDIAKHETATLGLLRELVARADAAGLADAAELRVVTRLSGKPAKLEIRGGTRGWPIANDPLTDGQPRSGPA